MAPFVAFLHVSLDRQERFTRSEMKTNSKKRASVKIITGLTVEINTVALKAVGGRP